MILIEQPKYVTMGRAMTCRQTALLFLLLPLIAGCSVYDSRYFYVPHPAQIDSLPAGADKDEPLRTRATVIGVRKSDAKTGQPASVEIRLNIENNAPLPATLDPTSVTLLDSNGNQFPSPILEPLQQLILQPGDQGLLTAFFPLVDNDQEALGLCDLELAWNYSLPDEQIGNAVTFTRRRYRYGYPYPDYGYPYTYRYRTGFP
jgi:hypothetical protein